VSAFGGVLITTARIDKATAEAIDTIFFEIICRPGLRPGCAGAAAPQEEPHHPAPQASHAPCRRKVRTALNGILTAGCGPGDGERGEGMRTVTTKAPPRN
jgi:phosphoribosylaminoimidazolecarboxamide formyltransferase/IMP cyclohydrolase